MIKFDNVFFKYNNSKNMTLADISFEVARGSWLTILGENGSGKSTLMKLLYGQNLATKGKILFENKEYTKETYNDIRQKIAVVFQNPDNQFVGATVEEDIAFGLENKNLPREKMEQIICEVLDIVDMKDYRKFEPTSLSGGQKQRVAIASALALRPEVLILDEATSMLDPVARKSILGYIKKINREQKLTIISITHDAEESIYSDNIIILEKGTIVYNGSYNFLYNDINILKKYHLEIPFLEKIKNELNAYLDIKTFEIEEDERSVVEKILAIFTTKKLPMRKKS